jgi:hypothetical protein
MIKPSIAGIVTGLSAVCILGVSCLGHCLLCASMEPASAAAWRDADAVVVLDADGGASADRIACTSAAWSASATALRADDGALPARDAARPWTEAEHRAHFAAVAAQGAGELEKTARAVLAGHGPDCEKVAVLRALCDAGSPRASEILAAAVVDLPDVSGPQGESVSRCALRFLAERAGRDAEAREALMRLAWSSRTLATGPRASAAATMAALATGTEAWQIVRWLQVEQDPLVRAAAVEALSRNQDPEASAAFRSLGIEIAAGSVVDGER